jgi:hypothetical protein
MYPKLINMILVQKVKIFENSLNIVSYVWYM